MDSVMAQLQRHVCQVKSCSTDLDQYEILCGKHWGMVPLYLKIRYEQVFKRLELDKRLDRSTAWVAASKRMGIMEASERLAAYHEVLKRIDGAVSQFILGEICQRIKEAKWDGEIFRRDPPLTLK